MEGHFLNGLNSIILYKASLIVLYSFVCSDEDDGSPVITREGFQFLLLDTPSQVWYFILQYLDTVGSRGLDLVECLTFLFQLSFSTMGKVRSSIVAIHMMNDPHYYQAIYIFRFCNPLICLEVTL
jgi:hypothetical protein